jgi:hypothetical protein
MSSRSWMTCELVNFVISGRSYCESPCVEATNLDCSC